MLSLRQIRTYDSVAGFYDILARLVFGNTLRNAQQYLVNAIPENAHILVVGGGTGWILEEITRKYPAGLTITYVDISKKMIALARKRFIGGNNVNFTHSAFETAVIKDRFNVVLTPFFLDNFNEDTTAKIIQKIDSLLLPGAEWLYCDFQNTGSIALKTILKIMYLFFRVCCGIEASQLPDVSGRLRGLGYQLVSGKTFRNEWIIAEIYKK